MLMTTLPVKLDTVLPLASRTATVTAGAIGEPTETVEGDCTNAIATAGPCAAGWMVKALLPSAGNVPDVA